MAFSIGGIVNKILDTFLPDVVGDIVGAAIDGAMGNIGGAVANGMDALQDLFAFLGGPKEAQVGEEMLAGTYNTSYDEIDAMAEQALMDARAARGD